MSFVEMGGRTKMYNINIRYQKNNALPPKLLTFATQFSWNITLFLCTIKIIIVTNNNRYNGDTCLNSHVESTLLEGQQVDFRVMTTGTFREDPNTGL
jgi:hypothetical protein